MAGATEGLDLNQALDVQSNVAAQVALNDDVSLIDVVTDLSLFFQSQVLDAGIGVDTSSCQDLVGSGLTDTVNVGQQKAAKVGFDWENVNGALDKLFEECEELQAAVENNDVENQREELGDVLFSAVNVARFLNIDSEHALYDACDKFTDRFSSVEKLANERGIDMKTAPLSVLDSLWDEVKLSKNY